MSLVNDMLKDLDERRRESRIGRQRLVPAGRDRSGAWRRGSVSGLLVVFALTVALGSAYVLYTESGNDTLTDRSASSARPESESSAPGMAATSQPVTTLAELEQRLAELERQNQLLASQAQQASVQQAAIQQPSIQQTSMPASSSNATSSAPDYQRTHSETMGSVLEGLPSGAPTVAPAVPATAPKHAASTSALGSSESALQRNAVELSLEELDRQQVQRALQLWSSGQQLAALQALDNFTFQQPHAHQSREALAKLLLQQGERERAMQVADVGLSITPAHPAYKKVKARLLFEQGHVSDALQLLSNFVPAVHQDAEYHDLMATAQLADRQYPAALATYQGLLQLDPEVGRWWYGMATALESLGRVPEAANAYERASQQADLSLTLRQRSQQRLQELRDDGSNVADHR